jgi:hypothetical protein
LEMHRLGGPDANEDAQHLDARGPLRHRRIEAVAALLDGWKVECRGIRDCLKEVGIVRVPEL